MTDREKLLEILSAPIYKLEGADPAEAVADFLIDNDVLPVVRCKDCKHFNFEHMECENEAVSTDHEGGASYSLNFYLDDFCSYGERKE